MSYSSRMFEPCWLKMVITQMIVTTQKMVLHETKIKLNKSIIQTLIIYKGIG